MVNVALVSALILALPIDLWPVQGVAAASCAGLGGDAATISGTSGVRFSGAPFREFTGERVDWAQLEHNVSALPSEATAETWVVITSIFEPTELMLQINRWLLNSTGSPRQSTCLLVVGDKKSPEDFRLPGQGACVRFLSWQEQELLPFASVAKTPWNHFGRKNLGYLFAMLHGAKHIYDTDDDNAFIEPDAMLPRLTHHRATVQISASSCALPAWNIYENFTSNNPAIWPRGLPLDEINRRTGCRVSTKSHSLAKNERVWVWQAIANHDPDVDAIYRLTQPLPVTFEAEEREIAIAPGTYVPFNAQATLWKHRALWCMYLPIGVHGRVSDIWR